MLPVSPERGRNSCFGFTLIEVLIAIFLGGILLLGVFRLYRVSLSSYDLQEQLSEMHQNANYTMHLLTEKLMQAGANLPETSFTVINFKPAHPDSLEIMENQSAAEYVFSNAVSYRRFIPLTDASRFRYSEQIVRITASKSVTTHTINSAFNEGHFINGIDTFSNPDTICLIDNASFAKGDRIYGFTISKYFCKNGVLYLNSINNDIAENIDFLSITFFDNNQDSTAIWSKMHFAKVYGRFRTSRPDKSYKDSLFNDGYHRIALSMDILMRNKL